MEGSNAALEFGQPAVADKLSYDSLAIVLLRLSSAGPSRASVYCARLRDLQTDTDIPKTIYVHLIAICLLVACKPSAEAKPLTSTATPSATPSQHVAPDASAHSGPKGITQDYFSCLGRASDTI